MDLFLLRLHVLMRGTLHFDPTLSILGGNNGLLDQIAIDIVIDS